MKVSAYEFIKNTLRNKVLIGIRKKLFQYKNVYKNRRELRKYKKIFKPGTFYIIRRNPPGSGLLSNFHYVLGHVMYALERDLVPVVDMENYLTFYNEDNPIDGTLNAWEYYFNQPLGHTLKHAYHDNNIVILSNMDYLGSKVSPALEYYGDKKIISLYNGYITKYLPFNEKVTSYADEYMRILFENRRNIVGVFFRGTDYKYALGHYAPPTVDNFEVKVEQLLLEWGMEWIYLVTEEVEVINTFKKKFGESLLVTDSRRIENYQMNMGPVPKIDFGRKHDKYLRNLEYLRDIILLSKCDSLICSKANGSLTAIELNNNQYRNIFVFETDLNT